MLVLRFLREVWKTISLPKRMLMQKDQVTLCNKAWLLNTQLLMQAQVASEAASTVLKTERNKLGNKGNEHLRSIRPS